MQATLETPGMHVGQLPDPGNRGEALLDLLVTKANQLNETSGLEAAIMHWM